MSFLLHKSYVCAACTVGICFLMWAHYWHLCLLGLKTSTPTTVLINCWVQVFCSPTSGSSNELVTATQWGKDKHRKGKMWALSEVFSSYIFIDCDRKDFTHENSWFVSPVSPPTSVNVQHIATSFGIVGDSLKRRLPQYQSTAAINIWKRE